MWGYDMEKKCSGTSIMDSRICLMRLVAEMPETARGKDYLLFSY